MMSGPVTVPAATRKRKVFQGYRRGSGAMIHCTRGPRKSCREIGEGAGTCEGLCKGRPLGPPLGKGEPDLSPAQLPSTKRWPAFWEKILPSLPIDAGV